MQKIKDFFRESREAEKKYLMDGKRTIAKSNIITLSNMSIVGLALVIVYLVAALIVIPNFEPAGAHLVFIPVMAVFAVVSTVYRLKGKFSPRIVTLMSVIFEITVYVFVILIDIMAHPITPACFAQLLIIVFSVTLIYSSRLTNILNIGFAAVFIFVDMMVKIDYSDTMKFDIFFIIVGLGFALSLGSSFRRNQVTQFVSKMRYKSLSMRDPLLENIFNKRGYEDAIDNYLVSRNPNVNCAFIVLDLNNFKHINDNYGHDMGDNILRCMSSTLLSLFRDSDIIGRFGGDEFIVLADGLCDEEAVEKKCRYIAELIGRRAQETGAIKVFSSLGAIICENQNVDFERLFELADQAMYQAKEMGRDADRFVLSRYTDEDAAAKA